MQALKEAPADMQCRDKLLFQCKVVEPETTAKDVTSEMVLTFLSSGLKYDSDIF